MKRELLLLEILRTCHRPDRSPEQIIERMKAFEAHIFEEEEAVVDSPKATLGKSKKKPADNTDILS